MLTKTDDASNTLYSDRYQQTYHSTFGALTESEHVFLHGSGVHNRLCAKQPTRVLEIGFGLGLNCLLCADSAATNNTSLDYTGIEHAPINAAAFQDLDYGRWFKQARLADDLAQVFSNLSDTTNISLHPQDKHDFATGAIGPQTKLNLHINDATSSTLLSQLQTEPAYDAIFLDAFSPDVNPECWTKPFFVQLSLLLNPESRLATYCVKGSVRRNLVAAGFSIHKYPGPKGKREVLWANLTKHCTDLARL